MTSIELSNENTVKILTHAFDFKDAFDTITICTEENSFKIIGVDSSSGIAAHLELFKPVNYSFDHSINFPILTKDFCEYLGYSTSQFTPSPTTIKLDIWDTHMNLTITSLNVCVVRKKFQHASGGIKSLPQIPSFDNEPNLTISSVKPLRLSYEVLKDTKRILLKMEPEKVTFSSPKRDPLISIDGSGYGTTSTMLSNYALNVVSRVWELSSIENLRISISKGGLTQFYYIFEEGVLWYVAAPSNEE
ncbi:MAG: hypothetical protein PVF58_08755 [Candidatus Methanofastidiosia archaeon]|jgi:hypothetical protein